MQDNIDEGKIGKLSKKIAKSAIFAAGGGVGINGVKVGAGGTSSKKLNHKIKDLMTNKKSLNNAVRGIKNTESKKSKSLKENDMEQSCNCNIAELIENKDFIGAKACINETLMSKINDLIEEEKVTIGAEIGQDLQTEGVVSLIKKDAKKTGEDVKSVVKIVKDAVTPAVKPHSPAAKTAKGNITKAKHKKYDAKSALKARKADVKSAKGEVKDAKKAYKATRK